MPDGQHFVRAVLVDFDGVIVDSARIKEEAFRGVLAGYSEEIVESFMKFHRAHGGISRYEKFRHLFGVLLGSEPDERVISRLSEDFSCVVRRRMTDPTVLIDDCLDFLRSLRGFGLHLVSAADQQEVRDICQTFGIATIFDTIHGSPTSKVENIARILSTFGYRDRAIYIGDAIDDRNAAHANGIRFVGYNNPELRGESDFYVDSFAENGGALISALGKASAMSGPDRALFG